MKSWAHCAGAAELQKAGRRDPTGWSEETTSQEDSARPGTVRGQPRRRCRPPASGYPLDADSDPITG